MDLVRNDARRGRAADREHEQERTAVERINPRGDPIIVGIGVDAVLAARRIEADCLDQPVAVRVTS